MFPNQMYSRFRDDDRLTGNFLVDHGLPLFDNTIIPKMQRESAHTALFDSEKAVYS